MQTFSESCYKFKPSRRKRQFKLVARSNSLFLFLVFYFQVCYLCRCCTLTGLDLRHTHTHYLDRIEIVYVNFKKKNVQRFGTMVVRSKNAWAILNCTYIYILLSHFLRSFNLVCTLYIKSAKWVEPLVKFVVYAWLCACVEWYTTLIYLNAVGPKSFKFNERNCFAFTVKLILFPIVRCYKPIFYMNSTHNNLTMNTVPREAVEHIMFC